ncbi:sigma-70 region 4 domain-containing protein [Candidatus Woesearchaeota archaeon]|nr:sigma-70 region 4 domain-containing protein [Candidatus Woesearchaeota archaeon]
MYKIHENETVNIPSSIFKDRRLKVLEVLVEYMKENLNLSYKEIAVLLNRNERTIWTVYNRAKKKLKKDD